MSKLYTEFQIKKAIELSRSCCISYSGEWRYDYEKEDEIFKLFTPIELPSDEEIKKIAIQESEKELSMSQLFCKLYLKYGAKWMRDKIEGNNEQQ